MPSGVHLCQHCSSINLDELKKAGGYTHQPNLGALRESADSCRLCALITEAIFQHLHDIRARDAKQHLLLSPIRLFAVGEDGLRQAQEALQQNKLSPCIIATMGELEQDFVLRSSWAPVLEMYSLQGETMNCVVHKTNVQNLGDMEESIPTLTLPQTIRDAFQVARELNVRYIWIDALCIV